MIKPCKSILGQALVEWCIFGCLLAIFWTASWQMGVHLLKRTLIESVSVVASRQALSNKKALPVKTMYIQQSGSLFQGNAQVQSEEKRSFSKIFIPEKTGELGSLIKQVLLPFNWRSFGFPSSTSLE